MDEQIRKFFKGFIEKKEKIVVGSPTSHGPFKTSARDGHYISYLNSFWDSSPKCLKNLQ